MNYVYILCCNDNSLYTGWTPDLKQRLQAHRSGKGAKYTRGRSPLKLVYFETYENKSDALKREVEIKRYKRSEKLALILANPIDCTAFD